jgi:hypothetical protein
MIPKPVLVKFLKARDVQKCVERCPQVPVITTRVFFESSIEHMVPHLGYKPCQPGIPRIKEIILGQQFYKMMDH